MAVRIGSARIDENGQVHGGKAGDQTGKEVSTQAWYQHPKGWVCIRCKDADKAEKIAECMEKACANPYVGYNQYRRNDLYKALYKLGFDPDRLEGPADTDCSALSRVCNSYAGIYTDDYTTGNCVQVLRSTGEFEILKGSKYTTQSGYLKRGDILCTKVKGHVVVVLDDGANVSRPKAYSGALGLPRKGYLQRGDTGTYVKRLQRFLNWFGSYDLEVDGIYGELTEAAVESFQRRAGGLVVDGIFGKKSLAKAKTIKK